MTMRGNVVASLMNTQPSFQGIVIALALALSWMGGGQPVLAQVPGGISSDPVPLMRQALTLLEHADHDYEGHRAAAVKELQGVLRALNNPNNGRKKNQASFTPGAPLPPNVPPRPGKNKQPARNLPETQAASDAQLKQAEDLLVQAAGALSDVPLQHVNAAIAQIHTALQLR